MGRLLLRRVLLTIPTLLIVSILIFSAVRALPGDVVHARLGQNYNEEQAKILRAQLGLNKPFVPAYLQWLGDALHGNLGHSLEVDQHAISTRIVKYYPVTLELMLLAVCFSVAIGIPIGVYAAVSKDTVGDYLLRSFAVLGLAIPGFYVAMQLLGVLAKNWGWLPPLSYTSLKVDFVNNLAQMWMPALILSLATAAQLMRMTRAMMLEVLRQDYVRTARSKGLRDRTVILRHALRNALLPVLTLLGLTMVFLIGGTVIFESLFNLPGMGTYLISSVNARDYPAIEGIALVFALSVVVINLVVDVSCSFLDPRIKAA